MILKLRVLIRKISLFETFPPHSKTEIPDFWPVLGVNNEQVVRILIIFTPPYLFNINLTEPFLF